MKNAGCWKTETRKEQNTFVRTSTPSACCLHLVICTCEVCRWSSRDSQRVRRYADSVRDSHQACLSVRGLGCVLKSTESEYPAVPYKYIRCTSNTSSKHFLYNNNADTLWYTTIRSNQAYKISRRRSTRFDIRFHILHLFSCGGMYDVPGIFFPEDMIGPFLVF